MKELFDYVTKLVPQPFLIALLVSGCVYFAVYYQFSFQSYGDAFRHPWFRSAFVICIATAFLYVINSPQIERTGDKPPIILVPQFLSDNDDTFRNPLVAEITTKIAQVMGREDAVLRLRSFVNDRQAAIATMRDYGVNAILFETSVSKIGNEHLLCLKLMTGPDQVACFSPFSLTDRSRVADSIVIKLAGQTEAIESGVQNPLVARLVDLERRVNAMQGTILKNSSTGKTHTDLPKYSKKLATIVGINKVKSLQSELRYSKSDAQAMSKLLSDRFGFETSVLLDSEATRQRIFQSVENAAQELDANSIFLFYFAGNGSYREIDGSSQATLIPFDFDEKTDVITPELVKLVNQLPCRHKILVVDTCHSTRGLDVKGELDATQNVDEETTIFWGASGPNQYSSESTEGGAFTAAIIKVLNKMDSQNMGGTWLADLAGPVSEMVTSRTSGQSPEFLVLNGHGNIALTTSSSGTLPKP